MDSVKRKISWALFPLLIALALCGCSDAEEDLREAAEAETEFVSNGVNNVPLGGLSVFCDDVTYYVGEGENGGERICSMTDDGENDTVLYTPDSALDQISCLNTDGKALYFLETVIDPQGLGVSEQRIRKLDPQSGAAETLENAAMVTNCLTYHDGDLYYTESRDMTEEGPYWTEEDYGGDYRLMRLSAEGGEAEKLTDFLSANFLIYGDRVWCGPDEWLNSIVSFDLNGGDKKEIYVSKEDGVDLITVYGGRVYFREYVFEAESRVYSVDLNGKDRREITLETGTDCNVMDGKFYFMAYTPETYVSDSDLSVETDRSGGVSGSDLTVEEKTENNSAATSSDLVIEGADSLRIIPGSTDRYCCELTKTGNMKLLYHKEGGEEHLGSFSGSWRFYSVSEPKNGRTLYKVRIGE